MDSESELTGFRGNCFFLEISLATRLEIILKFWDPKENNIIREPKTNVFFNTL